MYGETDSLSCDGGVSVSVSAMATNLRRIVEDEDRPLRRVQDYDILNRKTFPIPEGPTM